MRYCIIINCLFSALWLTSQVSQNTVRAADSLLYFELQHYTSTIESERQQWLIKKVNFYLRQNITGEEVLKEVKRIKTSELNGNGERQGFLWNAALLAYLNDDTDYSRFCLNEYGRVSADTSVSFRLMLILANKYSDTALANLTMRQLERVDGDFKKLSCFMESLTYKRKHLNFYMLSSALLPGSGSIMNGAVFKGILSLAISSAAVYGIYSLVQYGLYANAILWGTGLGLKFYNGNIRLTEKVFEQKQAQHKNKLVTNCEAAVKKLLDKYPLSFYAN